MTEMWFKTLWIRTTKKAVPSSNNLTIFNLTHSALKAIENKENSINEKGEIIKSLDSNV